MTAVQTLFEVLRERHVNTDSPFRLVNSRSVMNRSLTPTLYVEYDVARPAPLQTGAGYTVKEECSLIARMPSVVNGDSRQAMLEKTQSFLLSEAAWISDYGESFPDIETVGVRECSVKVVYGGSGDAVEGRLKVWLDKCYYAPFYNSLTPIYANA